MKSRVLTVLLALVLTPMASPFTLAQTNSATQQANPALGVQDWQGLRDLKPDKRIRVELKAGAVLDGKFISLNGSTLILTAPDDDTYRVEQHEIYAVYRLNGRSRESTARIGAVIGLVVGSVIGGKRSSRLENDPNRIHSDEDLAPLFAGISWGTLGGAAAGALLGGPRKGKLLYEAK